MEFRIAYASVILLYPMPYTAYGGGLEWLKVGLRNVNVPFPRKAVLVSNASDRYPDTDLLTRTGFRGFTASQLLE